MQYLQAFKISTDFQSMFGVPSDDCYILSQELPSDFGYSKCFGVTVWLSDLKIVDILSD